MFTSRRRLATLTAAGTMVVAAAAVAGSGAAATTPPTTQPPATTQAPADTSFLRAQAEAQFLAENPDATQIACAVPAADEPGVQFYCYGALPDGAVLALQVSMNDDGGLVFERIAGASTDPAAAPETTEAATYSGEGSTVVQITPLTGLATVVVTHDGAGEVAVQPQNAGAAAGTPLVAAGSGASSRFLVGLDGAISAFAVTAQGTWTIAVEPTSATTVVDPATSTTGTTPDVLRYADGGDATLTFDVAGTIVVRTVTADGVTTLVDSTGPLSQRVTLPTGPGFLTVVADGPWSFGFGDPEASDGTAVG